MGGLAGGEIGDKIGAKLAEKLPVLLVRPPAYLVARSAWRWGKRRVLLWPGISARYSKAPSRVFPSCLGGILKALSPFDTGSGIAGQEQGFGDRSALLQGKAIETLRLSLTEERQRLANLERGTEEYDKQRAIVEALELKFEELAGAQATVWEGQQGIADWMAGHFTQTWDRFFPPSARQMARDSSVWIVRPREAQSFRYLGR